MAALSTLAGNLLRNGPYRAGQPTLGGVDATGPHVYSLDGAGGVMEDDYVAAGSGMQLAYGVLEREYEPDLSSTRPPRRGRRHRERHPARYRQRERHDDSDRHRGRRRNPRVREETEVAA